LISATSNGARWKMVLAGLIFRKEVGQFRRIQQYYEEFSNPQLFSRHVSYLKLLFRSKEHGEQAN